MPLFRVTCPGPLAFVRIYPAPQYQYALPQLSRAQLMRLLCLFSHAQRMVAALLRSTPLSRRFNPRAVLADRLACETVVQWLHGRGMLGGGSNSCPATMKRKRQD